MNNIKKYLIQIQALNNTKLILLLILLLGLFLRFLFFPGNVQFAYDQARDAFISNGIMQGHFKIVGPPSNFSSYFNHGVLFYYIGGPVYKLAGGNPAGLSLFLRIYNLFGIILIFLISKILFNRSVALISAFLFAISFEQTQYSIFMSHPTMAVLPVLLTYLGFALLIFKNKQYGLILAVLGYGISIQFHIGLLFQGFQFLLIPLIFRRKLPKISIKTYLLSALCFMTVVSTFIAAEFKYDFRMMNGFILQAIHSDYSTSLISRLANAVFIFDRYFQDNLININILKGSGSLLTISLFVVIFKKYKNIHSQLIFLATWLLWGLAIYLYIIKGTYYYSICTSIPIIILAAFAIYKVFQKNKTAALLILLIIFASNLFLIIKFNPLGPVNAITAQDGMLLKQEEQIIDLTYQKADKQTFAVNALTIPYDINTTWSYLYNWYGQTKYGYKPIWGGSNADGYINALTVNNARSTLPNKRFLIIESMQGLNKKTIDDFLRIEGYFTNIIDTTRIGKLTLYEQQPK